MMLRTQLICEYIQYMPSFCGKKFRMIENDLTEEYRFKAKVDS